MSGGDQLYGQDLADAQALWDQLCTHTVAQVRAYLDAHPDKHTRVHKSVINRLLEPFMWHTIIATADQDGWANLFAQRCSTDAQPEFAEVAHLMRDAIDESEPALLQPGQWHLPYVTDEERATHDLGTCLKLSAARCARVSYLNHDGLNELAKDLGLTDRLAAADPIHASPFEHQATPARADLNPPGNLSGWQQWRHQVEVAGVG